MRLVSRLAICPALLLALLASPATALGDVVPWEIENHPNPCLEHKRGCSAAAKAAVRHHPGPICAVLAKNCTLHSEGKYHPFKVKENYEAVRMAHEPDACWTYRQQACGSCVGACPKCADLSASCKDQLYFHWLKAAQEEGQAKKDPAEKKKKKKKALKKKPGKKPVKKAVKKPGKKVKKKKVKKKKKH